ncbi:MAG: DUF2442 domain-containing protein [Desulfobacula sp.]|uniref:DUF2442 domain-containing protein n=1 Tax=Desulfobacula sp. TaxID=2593537 RepID=UPI0025C523E4|nr:DUF2442 domain-containing protein [Desulfobacula sp.]MCD4720899.1 DUF2442 domain-containing protein [Desulfobacula sp.]
MSSPLKTPWDKIISVTPADNYSLELLWDNTTESIISLKKEIHDRDIFWRLRYPRYFSMVRIDPLGGLFWPEGEDMCPEYLASLSLQSGMK